MLKTQRIGAEETIVYEQWLLDLTTITANTWAQVDFLADDGYAAGSPITGGASELTYTITNQATGLPVAVRIAGTLTVAFAIPLVVATATHYATAVFNAPDQSGTYNVTVNYSRPNGEDETTYTYQLVVS